MLNSNTKRKSPGYSTGCGSCRLAVAVQGCNTARVLLNFQASLFHNIHKKVIEIRETRLFSWQMFTENCFDASYCDTKIFSRWRIITRCDKTPQKSFLDGELQDLQAEPGKYFFFFFFSFFFYSITLAFIDCFQGQE